MSSEASTPYRRPRSLNPHPIPPASFATGLLSGLTVRVQLEEIQKADLGRKYARKDKRPLDPPPVVLCSFASLVNSGATGVREQGLDVEMASLGSVCYVDLFRVPDNYEEFFPPPNPDPLTQALPPMSSQHGPDGIFSSANADFLVPFHFSAAGRFPQAPPSFYTTPVPAAHDGAMLPGVLSLVGAGDARQTPVSGSHDPDVVAWFGSFPIHESASCSAMLAGATFVQAEIVDYNGKKEAMFVFSDIAVKVEGTFVLRYRTMNLASQTGAIQPYRILAECYGGPFKVYSTKEFPGLPPSTALTKLLSLYNIRVNMRENERKRRKKSEIDADLERDSAPATAARRGGLHALSTEGAGPSSPTRSAQYSPTTSVASSVASGSHARPYPYPRPAGGALPHRAGRGYGRSLRGGMDRDESSEEY